MTFVIYGRSNAGFYLALLTKVIGGEADASELNAFEVWKKA